MKISEYRSTENGEKYTVRHFGAALILQLVLHWARGAIIQLVSLVFYKSDGFLYILYGVRIILTVLVFLLPLLLYLRLAKKSLSDILRPRGNAEIYRAECGETRFNALFFVFASAITLNIANLAGMVTDGVYQLFGAEPPSTGLVSDFGLLVLSFISSVVIAPILEETLFRGVALNALAPYGMRWTVLFSGVLFALMHYSVYQLFYAFCAGCAIAFFAYVSNSLRVAIGLHLVNNLLTFITMLVSALGGATAGEWFGYILLAVTLPLAIVGAVFFIRKKLWRADAMDEAENGGGSCGGPVGHVERSGSDSPICAEILIYAVFALISCF